MEKDKDQITEKPQEKATNETPEPAACPVTAEESPLEDATPLSTEDEALETPNPEETKPSAVVAETAEASKDEDTKTPSNAKKKPKSKWFMAQFVLVNFSRFFLAITFLLSAFFKANDPVGFGIKLSEYAGAIGVTNPPSYLLMLAGILLTLVETILGIYLFVGVRRMRRIAELAFLFMAVMTLVTLWIVIDDPVEDCGCFGDAIILSNGLTFVKNLFLLAMAWLVTLRHKMVFSIVPKNWNWLITIPVVTGMTFYFTFCAYMLPVFDFLPFAEGTDLRKTVDHQMEFEGDPVIVYTNGTETLELSPEDEDPDSTVWTYVETRIPKPKKKDGKLVDFFVQFKDGDFVVDVTDELLENDGYVLVVTAPDLETASEACSGKFNSIYDYAERFGYGFYFITSATEEQKEKWKRNTGAQYEIYESDGKVLWEMVRDNPGLILMKDGVILRKWSQMGFPEMDYTKPLDKEHVENLSHTTRFAVSPIKL